MAKAIVLIPAYNEESSIRAVAEGARRHCDVCVINDASTDRTLECLQSMPDIVVIDNPRNLNITASIRRGLELALERGYDFIVTMDAGLSHDPQELVHLLAQSDKDLVLTFRRPYETTFQRKLLSAFAAIAFNFLQLARRRKVPAITDVTSGYRGYSAPLARRLLDARMKSVSFGFHFESLHLVLPFARTVGRHAIAYRASNSSLNFAGLKDGLGVFLHYLFGRDS